MYEIHVFVAIDPSKEKEMMDEATEFAKGLLGNKEVEVVRLVDKRSGYFLSPPIS